MTFDPGFGITVMTDPMGFVYGPGVAGPDPELRSLDAIRPSLMDKECAGPEYVYCIAMDVARGLDISIDSFALLKSLYYQPLLALAVLVSTLKWQGRTSGC